MINPAIKTNPPPERASPRVLYVLRYYPRFSETFIVNEILELERQGVEVQILSMRRPDDGFFHESVCRVNAVAGYMPETTEKLRKRALPHARRILARAGREARRKVRALRRKGHITSDDVLGAIYVIRQIQKSGVDHVHVHFGKEGSTLVYLASILAGVPYSMTLHAFDIFRDDVDRELLSRKINAAKRVVTVSDYNRRFLMEHFDIQDPDKVCVLYNGIDTDRFVVRPTRRKAGTILSVGRLIEKKGFIYLIDAVALLRDEGIDVTCRILGEGKHADQVRQHVIDRNVEDRVELPGLVRQDRVSELMSEAGCFVLPCIRAADGNVDALPTVLLEAMACGTPCISTRISGIPEIIDDRVNGLLVKPGNARALADAIKHLMQDPGQAEQLGRNARQKVETCFDVRKNVATLHDLFVQMTTGDNDTQPTADMAVRQTITREKVRSA